MNSIKNILDSLPNNPVKIFEALNLPVTYIDDVELVKGDKGSVFNYQGKKLFSPEIVAVTYYESNGHLASWSEGVAFDMVREAFGRSLCKNLFDQLEYVGVKADALLVRPRYSSKENRAITRSEIIKSGDLEGLEAAKPDIESVERDHHREKVALESRDVFPIGVERLIKKDVEWIKFLIDSKVSIRLRCSAEKLIDLFGENLEKIGREKSLIINELRFPAQNSGAPDHRTKFANEWTMKFARQMIFECDFYYLLQELYRFSRISPRWDLTVIDGVTKKLRYVEVKLNDNFTDHQRGELSIHLCDGGNLELCKIRPNRNGV